MDLRSRLKGKVAVITGGAGTLGSATCRRLVAEGAQVVIADYNGPGAEALAAEIGVGATAYQYDGLNQESIKSLIEDTVQCHGRIDLLHNNAVSSAVGDGAIVDADPAVWDTTYQMNVRGYMLGAKYALPHMKKQGAGVIVNMASGAALKGDLTFSAYGVLKAAAITLAQYIATQHGKDGIRAFSICPGAMLSNALTTGVGPEGIKMMERHHLTPYLGDPASLAALIAFLMSEDASFLTGINIPIDGGLFAHNPTYADRLGSA